MRLPTPLVLVLVGLALAVLLGLGSWQVARDRYKHDLARERDAAIAERPLTVAEARSMPGDEIEFRRLVLAGVWDYEQLQVVGNVLRFGVRGEQVIVPLRAADGGPAILVDRGWYPREERAAVLAALPAADADLEGLALGGGGPRAAQAGDGTWTRFDVASMAAALPYPVEPWRVIAGELVDEWPQRAPAERPVTGYQGYRNTTPHLGYALTWYGLAAALVVTAAVRLRRGGARAGAPSSRAAVEEGDDDGDETD